MPTSQRATEAIEQAPGVTVVIPCYNGVERLPATLAHLARQRVPEGLAWEVVVVDNASTDGTAELAERVWRELDCSVPFRVVAQPIAGTAAARKMGAEASRYTFILFCDDDNWLDEDYVRLAFEAHRFQHDMSERRLQWPYFLQLVEMTHRTAPVQTAYLDALRDAPSAARRSPTPHHPAAAGTRAPPARTPAPP